MVSPSTFLLGSSGATVGIKKESNFPKLPLHNMFHTSEKKKQNERPICPLFYFHACLFTGQNVNSSMIKEVIPALHTFNC